MSKFKNHLVLSFFISIALISCSDDEPQNNDVDEPKKLGAILQYEGDIVRTEIEFKYGNNQLIQTSSTRYYGETPSIIVQDYEYQNDRLMSINTNESLSNLSCSMDKMEFIYVDDVLVKFTQNGGGSYGEIEIERNNDNIIIGYSENNGIGLSWHDAIITIVDNNFIDIVEALTGKRNAGTVGIRGINEYDSKNSPFSFFSDELRTFWTFSTLICKVVVGEMIYSISVNNRISTDPEISPANSVTTNTYEYDDDDYPISMISVLESINVDTGEIYGTSTIKYTYTYLNE